MPDWVMYLLFGLGALALVWWLFQAQAANKLPSGNTATKPATVNPSGTQYGNLT